MKNYATSFGNGVDSALSHSERARARASKIFASDGECMKTESQKISPMPFICARRAGAGVKLRDAWLNITNRITFKSSFKWL